METLKVEQQHNLYVQRINRVIDYVRDHLTEDLSLETLAKVAYFSPFHFHRLFKTLTGETVNDFTTRLRLERAVALIRAAPKKPVLEAALEAGFTSAPVFSRAFKKQYGISPRAWDRNSALQQRKNGQVLEGFPYYTQAMLDAVADSGEFEVKVRDLPVQRLATVRVFHSYTPEPMIAAYLRLMGWYQARGGRLSQTTVYGMSQDDPDVTPLELCRYDYSLLVPDGWTGENEIVVREFPACRIASIHYAGDIYGVARAWQYLFRYWLPRSRYQPDNLPALEIFRRLPEEIGWETFDLECAVPVTAL
jgi:AraC family transcriptional regulator